MAMDIFTLDIKSAAEGLREKKWSAEELTRAALARIGEVENKLQAFITVTQDAALAAAKAADQRLAAGEGGALLGIPASIKDVVLTAGVETTAASNMLRGYMPAEDATVIAKLKAAGMVSLGKVNCDAFAHGASTENSDFGPSRNPWDLARVPGGSSGGSAAAVMGGEGFYSVCTDTGGSIRQPAAFCGAVGLKPTYGRVSRYGLISMTSSTDCPGVIAKTVTDAAYVLEVIAGYDPKDSTGSSQAVEQYSAIAENFTVRGKKIGVPKEYFSDDLNGEIRMQIEKALQFWREEGAFVEEVSLPHTEYAVPVYYVITPSEISSNLARFDGIRFGFSVEREGLGEARSLAEVYLNSKGQGFGREAKRRIMLGTYALSSGYYDAYYRKAQQVRTLIMQDFAAALKQVDVLVAPTAPTVAFKLGAHTDNPLEMYLEDIFLSAVSLAGLPAVSVPCGMVKPVDGEREMPIGMQIIGRAFGESSVLGFARAYEKANAWSGLRPQI